jgi:acetylornithine/succinyldiaminopimelate/putrescine aminotransferase/predicted amino acid dehydrogenase
MNGESLNPAIAQLLRLYRMDRNWVEGSGVRLRDDSGRSFLDFYAQYGAVALGHNHPAIVETITSALASSTPAMVQPYRAPYAVELAERLRRLSPGNLPHCVFTTSGAHAVETALKLVRMKTGRPWVLAARGSFHGKTLGALSLTGQRQYARGFGPLPRGVEHVAYGDLAALEQRLRSWPNRIAAFFVEPVQGERGVFVPPAGYLLRAQQLCREHGVALVVDEIQTGLGRTGRLFACELEGVVPDVLLLAKALGGGVFPIGACLASDEFWDDRFDLLNSSTFANNNLACRVGLQVLEILAGEGFGRAIAERGMHLQARLERMADFFSQTIRATRGRGLLAAIELRPISASRSCYLSYLHLQGLYAYAVAGAIAESASVLMLPTLGKKPVLRIAPPLTITEEELDEGFDALEETFARLEENPARTIVDCLGIAEHHAENSPVFIPTTRRPKKSADFAFLIHYTRPEDVALTDPGLSHLSKPQLRQFCTFASRFPAGLVLQTPAIVSRTRQRARGYLITIPMLPEQMLGSGRRRVSQMIGDAVDLAASLGARVVGLGGYTTPFSRRGRAVVGRGISVTTGNALTAGAAATALENVATQQGIELGDATIGIVGAGGSVGKLCARWFARQRPRGLVLVGNPKSDPQSLALLGAEISWRDGSVTMAGSVAELAGCDLVLSASGAIEPILETAVFKPGAIICDVARPPDSSARLRSRLDITVIEGGLIALPDPDLQFGAGNLLGLPNGVQLACFAETMLLALEGTTCDHGIGDEVPLSEVDGMLALAAKHGFRPTFLRKSPDVCLASRPESAITLPSPGFPLLLPEHRRDGQPGCMETRMRRAVGRRARRA